jgi:hypothetical protein
MFVHIVLDFLTKQGKKFLNLAIFLGLPKEFFFFSLGEKKLLQEYCDEHVCFIKIMDVRDCDERGF